MRSNTKLTKATVFIFLLIFLISIQHLHQSQNNPPKMSLSKVNSTIDPYEFLHIIKNPDGTITRLQEYFPNIPASTTNNSSPTLSRDVVLNPDKKTSVRIYLPRSILNTSEEFITPRTVTKEKLPIIVFVHGGGFVLCSVGTPVVHEFCSNAASQLAALVISVEYRLTPEHRLPAAYEDVFEALSWVKEGKDEWVIEYGNLSRCVLMGESAGGNIAYQVGLKAAVEMDDLKPLVLSGLVLIQPYFGGEDRTGSEIRLVDDPVLPLVVNDLMWNLSLPVGANRSHEYSDPFVGSGSSLLDRVRDLGLPVRVMGSDGDPLFDRYVKFMELLKMKGLDVRSVFDKGGSHGMYINDPIKMKELFAFVINLFCFLAGQD